MNGLDSFRVLAADRDASTVGYRLISVLNLVLQFCHRCYAGRRLVMYKTGDVEVALSESRAYVVQVHTDVLDASFVIA